MWDQENGVMLEVSPGDGVGHFYIEKTTFQTEEPSRMGAICCLSSQLLFLNIFDSQTLLFFGESLVKVLMAQVV